jgi:uncharacterized MAPEG superfamily protein
MDMTTMSTPMMLACVLLGLLLLTFLVLGIAAEIKYLWFSREPRAISETRRPLAERAS